MKFKMRLLDYFILLIFLAVIGFAAMKVFTKKSGSRILMGTKEKLREILERRDI